MFGILNQSFPDSLQADLPGEPCLGWKIEPAFRSLAVPLGGVKLCLGSKELPITWPIWMLPRAHDPGS